MPLPDKQFPTIDSDDSPRWFFWCLLMPGLTEELLIEAGKEYGVMIHAQMNAMSPRQWNGMRAYCETKLGLTKDWDQPYYATIANSPKNQESWNKFTEGQNEKFRRYWRRETN